MDNSPPRQRRPILDEVSVLVPTLGRELLAGCLDAIVSGSVWPETLLVVDQGTSAEVAAWLERLRSGGMRVLHHPSAQKGTAAAMNRGLERVRGSFVAVTHDDCVPAPDWLERLYDVLRHEPDSIVTGRVEPGGVGVVVSVMTSPIPARYRRPSLLGEVLFPNNMGFSVEVFERVGPFDERSFLRVAEDNDWSYRALRLGVPIVYAPEVVVTHLDWRDEAQLEATYRGYARSQGGFFGKHLRRGDPVIALRVLLAFARALVRWLRGAARRDSDLRANGRAFLTQLLPGILAGLRGAE